MAAPAKATIDDIDVHGKRVLLREDLNVPMRDGAITDDRRIREAIPTIEALRSRDARVIVIAHLGRPKGRIDDSVRLGPIAARLSSLLGADVRLASDVVGDSAQSMVASLRDGDVGMLENVRFEPGEEANDPGVRERSSPPSATSSSTTPSAPRTAPTHQPRGSRTCSRRSPAS